MNIPEEYLGDCKEIVESCQRQGLTITLLEAYSAWNEYSDDYAAGWLGLPYPVVYCNCNYTQEDCDQEIKSIVDEE